MVRWPEWWSWEIELSPHVFKRMVDRSFNETDLRTMMEQASGYHEDIENGRWVVSTRHSGCPWEVIVEPLMEENILLVVTGYPVE